MNLIHLLYYFQAVGMLVVPELGIVCRDLPKGVDHGNGGAWAYNGGVGVEPPAGFRGRAKAPWSWKPFVHFHTKEGPKVKGKCLSPMSEEECFSQPWPSPTFSHWGVATQSAHAWIHTWLSAKKSMLPKGICFKAQPKCDVPEKRASQNSETKQFSWVAFFSYRDIVFCVIKSSN